MHVVEPDHSFINMQFCFRDYLRNKESSRQAYQELKYRILENHDICEISNNKFAFPKYTLQKNIFIKQILREAGYNGTIMNLRLHEEEWKAAKYFRDKYFFAPYGIDDPYTWTFNHSEHEHIVLYQGTEIIGYAHIQFWPDHRAAMRIIAIDDNMRNQHSGSQFLVLIEKWLKTLGFKSIHAESRQSALNFYLKNGYSEMPFADPESHESDPNDIPVGKVL